MHIARSRLVGYSSLAGIREGSPVRTKPLAAADAENPSRSTSRLPGTNPNVFQLYVAGSGLQGIVQRSDVRLSRRRAFETFSSFFLQIRLR
jgi:hypothetical protein